MSATGSCSNDNHTPDLAPPGEVARRTLVAIGVVGAFAALYMFRTVLFLFLIGVVLSMALSPAVAVLQRRGLSRASAAIVVYLLLGCGLVVVAVVGLPLLWQQALSLLASLPRSYLQTRDYLIHVPSELVSRLAERLPEQPFRNSGQPPPEAAMNAVAQGFEYAGLLARGIYVVSAMVILAFYWSVYEERTTRSLLLVVPQTRRDDARYLIDQIEAKLGAYLRAQGLLCLIVAAMVLVAYWLIGVPYALTLAILAGVLEAIPVFGPVLAAIPALFVALSASSTKALWALAAVIAIQQFESNVLVPRIMDRSVGVNSIVTLLAIAGFSAVLGLAGAVLAIPMAAVIQLLLDRALFRSDTATASEPGGRDSASVLHYQIRELVYDVRRNVRRKQNLLTERSDRVEEAVESLALELDREIQAAARTNGNGRPAGKEPGS